MLVVNKKEIRVILNLNENIAPIKCKKKRTEIIGFSVNLNRGIFSLKKINQEKKEKRSKRVVDILVFQVFRDIYIYIYIYLDSVFLH